MSATPDFALGELMSAWTAGPAAAQAPALWAEALAPGGVEAELRLLALAGHALEIGYRPQPPKELSAAAPFPKLSLPFLSAAQRARFRRILKDMGSPSDRRELLRFLAARGRAAHPLDWAPGPNEEELPALYAAWRDWAAGAAAPAPQEILSAENWEEWGKASRVLAFEVLRGKDPAAARELLKAKISGLKAEERASMFALLSDGLAEEDRPLLAEALAKDRAPSVKTVASALIERLDVAKETSPDRASELFIEEFLKVSRKGILKRELQIAFRKADKTAPERERFLILLMRAGLDRLAAGIEAKSRLEMVEAWPHDELVYGYQLRDLLLREGKPEEIKAALRAIFGHERHLVSNHLVDELAARLPEADLLEILPELLNRNHISLDEHLGYLGPLIGRLPLEPLRKTKLWLKTKGVLTSELEAQLKNEARARNYDLVEGLRILGGALDSAGAREALDEFTRMGLSPADPRFDLLHLNAELNADPLEAAP